MILMTLIRMVSQTVCANNNDTFDPGETLEPGVKRIGAQYLCFTDGMIMMVMV